MPLLLARPVATNGGAPAATSSGLSGVESMCKRTTSDPLLRRFLYQYGLHLLAIPRAGADVGDVFIFDGRRTAPAGSLRSLLDPPVELTPDRDEPMSDVAGQVTREVDVEVGLGLLEAFLGAIGASGIIQTVRAGYQRQNVHTLSFAFQEPIRDHIDVLELGAALDGRRFRPGHAIDPDAFRFYVTTSTARSHSLSVQAHTQSHSSVNLSGEVAHVVDVASTVRVSGAADGTVTYAGEQPLTFGVELYELFYDHEMQALRLAMPDEPMAVRGSARPRRAIIGDPAGDVLLAIE